MSALGKKDDGLLVWEQGYGIAVHQLTDLKQLLELEELLTSAKSNRTTGHEDHAMDTSSTSSLASESGSEICNTSTDTHEIQTKQKDPSEVHNGPNNGAISNQKVFVTGISKSKSISLDFRLSRGIAKV